MKSLTFETSFEKKPYGFLIEFETPKLLLEATRQAFKNGHRQMDCYSPFPIEDLAEELGATQNSVSLLALLGGVIFGTAAFAIQSFANTVSYPIIVAGRPDFSWQAFIPITFELTILGAALSAAFGMLFLNRLPAIWHPLFAAPEFVNATRDRFFLCIFVEDKKYDVSQMTQLLMPFNPIHFREVSVEVE